MEIQERITDIVRDKKTQIPTLPIIIHNILTMARDDKTSASDLTDFVSKDQAISTKILRLANSAYYGFIKEVASIQRAIAVIGFHEVISLTIGMGVFSSFSNKDTHGVLDMPDLWLHSIGCAFASKEIAKRLNASSPDQGFLNGLLHDMGKVIFARFFPKEYGSVLSSAAEKEVALDRAEKDTFGLDHAELSGLLMERWNFPDNLLIPSRYHHQSLQCPLQYRQDAALVQVADSICHRVGIGKSGNPVAPDVGEVRAFLKITKTWNDEIAAELKDQRPRIEAFLEAVSA